MSASRESNYSAEGCPVVIVTSTTRPIRPIRRRFLVGRLAIAIAMLVVGLNETGLEPGVAARCRWT